jgi:tetratricopeptide (TPR) repeat protein
LEIFTTLTKDFSFGEQVLALPMAPMANSYAQLQQYDQAFRYFDLSIRLTENHLGIYHNTLAEFLLNYAVAKYFHGQNDDSEKLLIRSWDIVNRNMRNVDEDLTCLRIKQLYSEIQREKINTQKVMAEGGAG